MQSGTIKFFNETKGFGFVVDTNSGEEIFVHVSGLVDKSAKVILSHSRLNKVKKA